jgi:hypothetical protein
MSGAVAAHAAYNGSGTQGLAVTNKIHDDDGDVMSVFWNKNDTTRQLLYGSSIIEIPAGGGSGSSATGSSSSVIFDVNNDIDCLGDMILKVVYAADGTTGAQASHVDSQQLATSISRVEVLVGTQIWQTLEHADLMALAGTELSSGSFADYSFQTSGGVQEYNQFVNGLLGTGNLKEARAFIPLKMFTKTLTPMLENFAEQTESGYLMGAAPHQQVKIKVYASTDFNPSSATGTINFTLYAKNQVMCNEEREQMKAMPMGLPKRIKMTQNASKTFTNLSPPNNLDFDLDHFSLYGSHIIISVPTITGGDLDDLNKSTVELLLNSSSFSGKLPLGLLKMTGPSMGLFTNEYGATGGNGHTSTYVFPLASRAYGGSSVPLNRFDNIRLKINWNSSLSFSGSASSRVNITCVGETTALYKGGAASLAMY